MFKHVCNKAQWVKGHALNRDAILKEIGIADPSNYYQVEPVGLMAVVHQMFGLHESDFRLVYTEYPPESREIKFQFVLIRDREKGKDAVDLMNSRELPRLPYDIEPTGCKDLEVSLTMLGLDEILIT